MAQTALRRGSQEEGNTDYFTGCPIGGGFMWFGLPDKIPTNCRICDNTTLAIAQFTKLHENLGGAWGTSGGNLNIPDLRGRFPRGVDGTAGNDPDAATRAAANAGGNTGDTVGSVQDDSFQGHGHNIVGRYIVGTGGGANGPIGNNTAGTSVDLTNGATTVQDLSGFGTAKSSTETRPKNANVYFVIRVN
jgi:microcystin-dependent protein